LIRREIAELWLANNARLGGAQQQWQQVLENKQRNRTASLKIVQFFFFHLLQHLQQAKLLRGTDCICVLFK
jgi:hypothetical protein